MDVAPTGAELGSPGPEPPALCPRAGGCCVPGAGSSVMGSGGGQRLAAVQEEISPSPSEHRALPGELGVPPASVVLPGRPWLCHQPAAPGPSAGHALWCLCSPPFLPAMLPRPEETSVAGKAPPSPRWCCMLRSAWLRPACLQLSRGTRACSWQAGEGGHGTVLLVPRPVCLGGQMWGICSSLPRSEG